MCQPMTHCLKEKVLVNLVSMLINGYYDETRVICSYVLPAIPSSVMVGNKKDGATTIMSTS